jgi:hypothetical protein
MTDVNDDNAGDGGGGDDNVFTEYCFDGTKAPVKIENIDHVHGAAVILGALQYDGHVITADDRGVLLIQSPGEPDRHLGIDS